MLIGENLLIHTNRSLFCGQKCLSKVARKIKVLESYHQRAYELGVISFLTGTSLAEMTSEYNKNGVEKNELES